MPAINPLDLKAYYSGGGANASGSASLGGARSSVQIVPQRALPNASPPPFSLVGAFGHVGAAVAAGTLSYTSADSGLTWTPAGGTAGTKVTLANSGADRIVTDSTDEAGIIFADDAAPPGADATYTVTVSNEKNRLWDNIGVAELAPGHVDVRCIFIRPGGEWTDAKVYLAAQPGSGVTLEVGLDPTAVNTSGVDAVTVADETTIPAGVTFSSPTTEPTALSIGTVAANNEVAVWLRRTSPSGQAQSLDDRLGLMFAGTVTSTTITATRWRLFFTAGHASQAFMEAIEFRETVGGPNLANTGNVSASSEENGFEATLAVDGSTVSHWNSEVGLNFPHWFEVTLGAATAVRELALTSAGMSDPAFAIEYHNGTAWVAAQSYSAPETSTWATDTQRPFTVQS